MAQITKLWIADKMREIMKHKPLSKIRVTEICKSAEIERPTFYYHFKDKYDLTAVLTPKGSGSWIGRCLCNRAGIPIIRRNQTQSKRNQFFREF